MCGLDTGKPKLIPEIVSSGKHKDLEVSLGSLIPVVVSG